MKWLSLLLLSTVTQYGICQNLVPNPSFEDVNTSFCGIMTAGDFNSTINAWYAPTQGSADLFFTDIDATCYNFMPISAYSGPIGLKGSQLPRNGKIMAGIFLYTIPGMSHREYLQVPLNSSMIVGQEYVVECWVSLADSIEYATDQLGMLLSMQAIISASTDVLNYSPQVISNTVISETQNWILISDTITATEPYLYLTIGNFSSDAQTPTVQNSTHSNNTYGSYYFIDDVRVEHLRGLGINENQLINSNRNLIKIIDFMGRETEFKPNTPLIYIYSDSSRERVFQSENIK